MIQCPCCKREWDDDCGQSACVARHGSCISCHFDSLRPRLTVFVEPFSDYTVTAPIRLTAWRRVESAK